MDKLIYSLVSAKNNREELNALLAEMKGISGVDMFVVGTDEVAAVVSDFDRSATATDRFMAIEYAGLIEIMAQHFTLLPVRFGSVMESSDKILLMLERNCHDIQQNLQKVDNKCEFGLKILCDPEKIMADLKIKTEAIFSANVSPSTESKNSVYREWVNKKLSEHRLEEMMITFVDSVIAALSVSLARLNTMHKFKKMVTATTIIDAVFLLDKEKKDTLIQSVEEVQKQFPGLNFLLTGPWPPYNFVEIVLK